MKQCWNCKKELQDDWILCPFCGKSADYLCSVCGKKLDADFKVCPYCGTPVNGDTETSVPVSPGKSNAAASKVHPIETDKEYNIGDTFVFGTYEQNALSDGTEDVEWIVLDKKGNTLLLISKYILDCVAAQDVAWKENEVRTWLNGEFLNELCGNNDEEKEHVVSGIVNNGDDESTQDKVFLLSAAEVKKYFSSEKLKPYLTCEPTDYAKTRGEADVENWILRDGPTSTYSSFSLLCTLVPVEHGGIRPALWLTCKTEKRRKPVEYIPSSPIPASYNPDSDNEQDDNQDQTT